MILSGGSKRIMTLGRANAGEYVGKIA